jgi:hypothetical protein
LLGLNSRLRAEKLTLLTLNKALALPHPSLLSCYGCVTF